MVNPEIYSCLVEPRLIEALADTPVVLFHGPCQCGKTALARLVREARGQAFVGFDDGAALAARSAGLAVSAADFAVPYRSTISGCKSLRLWITASTTTSGSRIS